MQNWERSHIGVAIIIIIASIGGSLWYEATTSNANYRTTIAIGESGIGIALSYLLVILYQQQRNIQEDQLKVSEQSLLPDIQSDINSTELNHQTAKFLVSNYGKGFAKNPVVSLNIDIPIIGKETSHKWHMINKGSEHNRESYISSKNTRIPFWADVSSEPFTSRSSVNKLEGWLFRRKNEQEGAYIRLSWKVEYEDTFGNSSEILAARGNIIQIHDGYSTFNQIKAQLCLAEYHAIEERRIAKIQGEIHKYLE